MSKSAILSSSIAKKYWMSLTGLFLCLFLVGHLLGNLQLIMKTGEEGQRAFNEYAYFMTHNPLIKVMSYLTYFSIIFHAIDGILLTIQNKKARPQKYANNKPSTNSSLPSRYMAILGTLVLVFISTHMASFWWKMKYSSDPLPLHKVYIQDKENGGNAEALYLTQSGNFFPVSAFEDNEQQPAQMMIKNGIEFYNKQVDIKMGEGYKDLHGLVMSFFGKRKEGFDSNPYAGLAVAFYVLSMGILAFHLWHGFASGFQSLGLRSKKYVQGITMFGKAFAIIVPALFALIPIIIYLF
jgi:succinate dehydrogenase / fumarate reductase cytochrome b subunit|tara:strand:- start:5021 stop:5905 length:885 start_codon:yes stop_codon:yes gene_type:complete